MKPGSTPQALPRRVPAVVGVVGVVVVVDVVGGAAEDGGTQIPGRGVFFLPASSFFAVLFFCLRLEFPDTSGKR